MAIRSYVARVDDIEIVGTAPDGIPALELVKSHRPDVLLTDIHMPHMTGVELIRRVFTSRTRHASCASPFSGTRPRCARRSKPVPAGSC